MWVTIGSGDARGTSVRVDGERFLIGTGPECQLMIGDPKVAPLHAYFEVGEGGRVALHDLGSDAGTYVDGERVDGSITIAGGERIVLGDTVLTPTVADPAEEARTRAGEAHAEREAAAAVRVRTEGQTVEVAPAHDDGDGDGAGGTAVRVATEGEAVEVVPVGEHRRLRERITRTMVAAAAAGLLAIAALVAILATRGGGKPSTADLARFAKPRTVVVEAHTGPRSGSSGTGFVLDA